ncbi:MAG: complement resistance protein TraT [Nocardiaceae bacterium]|nr:complement resistance protein TraT [Nocardiaceae bacterium]
MARHAAKQNNWARRAIIAGALPIAIAAASTGTAQAQDTGSANIPGLPQVAVPPLWNPYDMNSHQWAVFTPGYAPTPEQRIADYSDTGRHFGGELGIALGGSLIGVPVAGIAGGALAFAGPAFGAVIGPAAAGIVAATFAGALAGGSVGGELGRQAGADLAHQHNAEGRVGSFS